MPASYFYKYYYEGDSVLVLCGFQQWMVNGGFLERGKNRASWSYHIGGSRKQGF